MIIGYNLISNTTGLSLTPSSNDSNYPIANTLNYRNLLRHWRSTTSASNVSIVGTWSSQRALTAIMLNDINFSSVTIQGNNTDVWTSPAFSQAFTTSVDTRVNRRKIYCALAGFNYTFFRILIPAQTPDDFGVFRISSIIPIIAQLTLTQNPNWGYAWTINTPDARILTFPSGVSERNSMGNLARLGISMSFDPFIKEYENELYIISRIDRAELFTFFENFGDTSKCYLLYRNTDMEVSWKNLGVLGISRMDFEEAI